MFFKVFNFFKILFKSIERKNLQTEKKHLQKTPPMKTSNNVNANLSSTLSI